MNSGKKPESRQPRSFSVEKTPPAKRSAGDEGALLSPNRPTISKPSSFSAKSKLLSRITFGTPRKDLDSPRGPHTVVSHRSSKMSQAMKNTNPPPEAVKASDVWPMDEEERGDSVFEVADSLSETVEHMMMRHGAGVKEVDARSVIDELSPTIPFKNVGSAYTQGDLPGDTRRASSNAYSLIRVKESNKFNTNTSTLGNTTYTYLAASSKASPSASFRQQAVQVEVDSPLVQEEDDGWKGRAAYMGQSNAVMLNILEERGFDGFVEKLVDGTVEFVYLQYDPQNPYKFTVCSETPFANDHAPESSSSPLKYLTLSRNGITRHANNESESYTFKEFSNERFMYQRLLEIPVFYQFRTWKSFMMWNHFVKRKKYNFAKCAIGRDLMFLDPALSSMYFRIVSTCESLRKLLVIHIDKREISDMSEFRRRQKQLKMTASEKKAELISALVRYICLNGEKQVFAALGVNTCARKNAMEILSGPDHNQSLLILESSIPSHTQESASSSNSIVKAQQLVSTNKANSLLSMTFSDKSVVRQVCRRLYALLRLADFMLRHAMYKCTELNLIELLANMEKIKSDNDSMTVDTPVNKRSYGVFRLDNSLKTAWDDDAIFSNRDSMILSIQSGDVESTIKITPSPEHFENEFAEALRESVNFGSYSDILSSRDEVNRILVPIAGELPSELVLDDLVQDMNGEKNSTSLDILSKHCQDVLHACVLRSTELLGQMDHLRKSFDQNFVYRNQLERASEVTKDPHDLEEDLLRMKRELEEIDSMNRSNEVGVIRFEMGKVLIKYRHELIDCIELLQKRILSTFKVKCESFTEALFQLKYSISNRGKRSGNVILEEYALLMSKYKEAIDQQDSLDERYRYVIGLYGLIIDHSIEISEHKNSKHIYNMMISMWNQFQDALNQFNEGIELNLKLCKVALESRWRTLKLPLEEIRLALTAESLCDPTSPPDECLKLLESIQEQANTTEQKHLELHEVQCGLDLSVVNFEYLNDLMEIIRSLDKLWTLVRQIREFENLHKDMLFTEVDCDTTLQVVEKIELELQYKVTRENPKVCAFVRDRCMELNRLIPLVYKLQNKKDEITDRMSTLIVEELGFDIWPKDRGAVTLKFLIDHDILAHERELNLLHQQAVKEHNIHKKIWTLKYQLEDLSLHVEAYVVSNQQSSVYILSALPVLEKALHELSVDLQNIQASIHSSFESATICDIDEDIKKKQHLVSQLYSFQKSFMVCREFHGNPRIVRALHVVMRGFHELEEFWRSMMKLLRGESLSSNKNFTFFMTSELVEPYLMRLDEMIVSSRKIERHIHEYIDEQRRKYPKLYMYNRDTLSYIFTQVELKAVFEKVKGMLDLTDLIYDENDPYLTTGAVCVDETVLFRSPASIRSSIVDWLRGIDLALSRRLKYDIREFMEERRDVLDDIRLMTSLDQARLCATQIAFWKEVVPTNEAQLKSQLSHVLSQIRESGDMIFHNRQKNQRKAIYNILLIYIEQRDILRKLLDDLTITATKTHDTGNPYYGSNDFIVLCHMQKTWDPYDGSIKVQLGASSVDYGMNYQGFLEKLLITPLSARCYLALLNTFSNKCVAVLNGTHDSSKSTINRSLAYELGVQTVSRDCSAIHTIDDIHSILQATVGAGLWLTFHNVEVLTGRDDHLLSSLLGCILKVRPAIAGKGKPIVIGSMSIMPSVKPIRISMLYNGKIMKTGMIPLSLQKLFRPLCMFTPQRKLLLEKTMQLFDVPSSGNLAIQLASVCEHFVSREVINDKQATSCMIRAAKDVSYIYKTEPRSLNNGIGWNVFAKFIDYAPSTSRRYISIDDMKYVLNLFLNTVFCYDRTLEYLLKNPLGMKLIQVHHNAEERMSEFQKTLQSLPGHRAIDIRIQKENAKYLFQHGQGALVGNNQSSNVVDPNRDAKRSKRRKRQISFDDDAKQPEKIEIAPGKSPHIISSPKKSEVHKALDNVLSSNIIEENEESSRDSAERVDRGSTETNCDSPSPVSSLSPSRRQSGADSFDSGCSSPTIKGRKRVKRKSRKQSNSTEEFSESPDFRSWNRKGTVNPILRSRKTVNLKKRKTRRVSLIETLTDTVKGENRENTLRTADVALFEELSSDDEDESKREEDHAIHIAKKKAHDELKGAIMHPGDSTSVIVSGHCACGKTALIKNVLEDIDRTNKKGSRAISVFPYVIHPNIIMHGKHDKDSAKDYYKFVEKMERILNNYEGSSPKADRIIVVFESVPAALFISLLEWLSSPDVHGNLRYESYFFIWECSPGALSEFSPTVFYRCNILHLDAPRYYTMSEFTVHIARGLFDQSKTLAKNIIGASKPILNAFIDKYIELQHTEEHDYTRICLTENVLKLIRDMYYNCGGDHRQHFGELYVGNYEGVILRSSESVRRIIIFSCIWAIGTLPSWEGRKNFTLWFVTHFSEAQQEEPSIFPPFDDPFAYILRFNPDDVNELCWAYCFGSRVVDYSHHRDIDGFESGVNSDDMFRRSEGAMGNHVPELIKWKLPYECRLPNIYYDRSFRHNSRFLSSIEYMPTKESVALQLIQRVFLHKGGLIYISGEDGSGKSSLQRLLLMDHALKNRWVCAIGGSNASKLPQFMDIARKENSKAMIEGEQVDTGAIFIDDVSLPCELDSFRYILENSHYVGNNQLVYPLQFIYGVVSAKEGEIDITSFGRFMRYSLCVHLEESNLESVFTTMLANSCINMQPEICLEITAASAQIFNEISKLHPILDPEHHHDDDPEDPALDFCFNHSTASFLNYVVKSVSVASDGMPMNTRKESFRVLFSVIKDYIRDFPSRDVYMACIEDSLSKIDLPSLKGDRKFVEIVTKEWKRRVNPINSLPASSAYGYWPAETSVDIIKSRFSAKCSTEAYIPVDLDIDTGEFWRDVQKFCAMTTIDLSAAVILSYPTIMAARTVIKVATLLSNIDMEFHELQLSNPAKGLESLAKALAIRYRHYVQADSLRAISSSPRKTMWYIHVIGEHELSTHDILDDLFDVFMMTTGENESALLSESLSVTNNEILKLLRNRESLIYFGHFQIPVFTFSQSMNPVHLIEVCEGAKSRLLRPIHLSAAYTPSMSASTCPILRQVVGEDVGTLLDALIDVSIKEHRKLKTRSEVITQLTSSAYRGGTISTCIQLDKILTDWFHEHDDFLKDGENEKDVDDDGDDDENGGSESSSPSSTRVKGMSSKWMKIKQTIRYRTFSLDHIEDEEEARRDQRIKRRAAVFAVLLAVISRYPLISTSFNDRQTWLSDLIHLTCQSTRSTVTYTEISQWMCAYLEAKSTRTNGQEYQGGKGLVSSIMTSDASKMLNKVLSKHINVDVEARDRLENLQDQVKNFLSLSKWFDVFPIDKSSIGVTLIAILASYVLDRDITLIDLSILGKGFLKHCCNMSCEVTTESFPKDSANQYNAHRTELGLRHVIKVHTKNWDECDADESAKNVGVDNSSPILYIGGEGCLTSEIMVTLLCLGGRRLSATQPSSLQTKFKELQEGLSINVDESSYSQPEADFFSLVWDNEEVRRYTEAIAHLLRASIVLEGTKVADELWNKLILPAASLAYSSPQLPVEDVLRNLFSQLLCWSAAWIGEETFFTLKILLVLCSREDNLHAYTLAEEAAIVMYTYVSEIHRDNGSNKSWKKCLNYIVRTLHVLFPHYTLMKENKVVVPVMCEVNKRPSISPTRGRSLSELINEMLLNEVSKDDIMPMEIATTTGRGRKTKSHLIHSKWEITRRLNLHKKEVMIWREDMSFSSPLFPPIPLNNLSWAEMVVIVFYLKPQTLHRLIDTALFSYCMGGAIRSWIISTDDRSEIHPYHYYSTDNFDPMIDAFYPPGDSTRKFSFVNSKRPKQENSHDAPSTRGKGRFSEFLRSHFEYLCQKGYIVNDGTAPTKSSHYETAWAAMKAFVRGEEISKRRLELIMICRGSCGSSNNPSTFDSTGLLMNHLGVDYTSVFLSDNSNLLDMETFSSLGSKPAEDNCDPNDIESEEDLLLNDPCPSGHLHVFIDADVSITNITENLIALNSKFQPNNIFVEAYDVYPEIDKSLANTIPIIHVESYTHHNFVSILLHAAKVLISVNVRAPQEAAQRCARILWLLCLFYAHLHLQQPYPIVHDKILTTAAKLLQHMFYSFDNIRYVHGKFINRYLLDVVFEFLTDSHEADVVVKRVFKQVFRMDEYAISELCPYRQPQEIVPGLEIPSTFDINSVEAVTKKLSDRVSVGKINAVGACTTSCLDAFAISLKKLESKRHVLVEPYLRNSRSVYTYLLDELIKKMPPSIDLESAGVLDQVNIQKSIASHHAGSGAAWRRTKKTLIKALGLGRRNKDDKDIASSDTASTHDIPPLYVFALLEGHSFNRELGQTVMMMQTFRDWGTSSERLNDVLECLEALHHGLMPFNFATHQRRRLYHIPLTVDDFIKGWASHYWDINKWLTDGYPTSGVDVGCLQNPRGLLYAIKQNYAFKQKKTIDEVHLHVELVVAPSLKLEEDCVTLTGLHLHNATWNARHGCIKVLTYISDDSRHPCVKITASDEPQRVNKDEQYLCPLYVCASAHTCIAQPHSAGGESRQDNKDEELLLFVPVHLKRQPNFDRDSFSTSSSDEDEENNGGDDDDDDDYGDEMEVTPALFHERNCALHAGWRT